MKRRNFFAGLTALAAVSCTRKDQRQARYDPNQCPFCVPEPGVCSYCRGTAKCTFCDGTGTRKTTTASMPKEKFTTVEYEEKCPYCGGSGVCRYCEGSGKCWVCEGTGHIDHWNFFQRHKHESASDTGATP
ncbi:MAG: hypothetical protein GF418_16900 [Chitinivibrionales bacterium]|nr:hypothetical protein [Chitinivibrionales bacterium]MBD3397300.1 hypothetical protein [Chitinivibrionales bacterium]